MQIAGQIVVVTGANRGLGRRLVEALLDARRGEGLRRRPRPRDACSTTPRVVPVALDLLDRRVDRRRGRQPPRDATLLINNASTAAFAGPLDADRDAVRSEMAVNYDGTFDVDPRVRPGARARNGGGAIVNVLSLLSLASMPPMAGYSASKAAAHSLTQALRPVLAAQGDQRPRRLPGRDRHRHAGRRSTCPKTPPRRSPRASSTALAADREDIFPDPNAGRDGGDLVVRPEGVRARLQRRVSSVELVAGSWPRRRRSAGTSCRRSCSPTSRSSSLRACRTAAAIRRRRLRRLLQRVGALFELRFEPGPVASAGDTVVLQMQVTFTARATGRGVTQRVVELLQVRDGRLARSEVFLEDTAALLDTLTPEPTGALP